MVSRFVVVCWEEQAFKGKEKQILSSELLCFYWFNMIMKQSDETSFVTISLVEAPRVCAIAEHFMMINISLDKDFTPCSPNLFPGVKGFLCLILTCFNFLMFFQSSTAISKPPLFCWDCCFLGVFSHDTVCWAKKWVDLDVQYCFSLVTVYFCVSA